jgi:hypothetical protein
MTTRPLQVDHRQLDQTTTGRKDNLIKRQLDQNQVDQKSNFGSNCEESLLTMSLSSGAPDWIFSVQVYAQILSFFTGLFYYLHLLPPLYWIFRKTQIHMIWIDMNNMNWHEWQKLTWMTKNDMNEKNWHEWNGTVGAFVSLRLMLLEWHRVAIKKIKISKKLVQLVNFGPVGLVKLSFCQVVVWSSWFWSTCLWLSFLWSSWRITWRNHAVCRSR